MIIWGDSKELLFGGPILIKKKNVGIGGRNVTNSQFKELPVLEILRLLLLHTYKLYTEVLVSSTSLVYIVCLYCLIKIIKSAI